MFWGSESRTFSCSRMAPAASPLSLRAAPGSTRLETGARAPAPAWQRLRHGTSLYQQADILRGACRIPPTPAVRTPPWPVYISTWGAKSLFWSEAEKALRINRVETDGYNWLVNYCLLNEDIPRAEAFARQALERAPLFFPVRMNLGQPSDSKGDAAGAIREQEKVLDSDPQNIYAITSIAAIYTDANDLPKIRETLQRSRPADRQNYQIRIAWALMLLLEGKRAEAIKEMDEEVLKWAAVAFPATESIAQFYALLGETAKAIDWLDRSVRNGIEHADWSAATAVWPASGTPAPFQTDSGFHRSPAPTAAKLITAAESAVSVESSFCIRKAGACQHCT